MSSLLHRNDLGVRNCGGLAGFFREGGCVEAAGGAGREDRDEVAGVFRVTDDVHRLCVVARRGGGRWFGAAFGARFARAGRQGDVGRGFDAAEVAERAEDAGDGGVAGDRRDHVLGGEEMLDLGDVAVDHVMGEGAAQKSEAARQGGWRAQGDGGPVTEPFRRADFTRRIGLDACGARFARADGVGCGGDGGEELVDEVAEAGVEQADQRKGDAEGLALVGHGLTEFARGEDDFFFQGERDVGGGPGHFDCIRPGGGG